MIILNTRLKRKRLDPGPNGVAPGKGETESPPILPSLLVGISASVIYYLTSAPTITWIHESQDSGELAACAATLGITHPTGYPLYTLIGWCIMQIAGIDPGRAMVLLSCVFGAFGAGIIARVSALAIRLLGPKWALSPCASAWWGGAAGFFAVVNPLMWSQSVVCEVYSLAILLQALAWLLALKYLNARQIGDRLQESRSIVWLGLVVGLILAHHIAGAGVLLPIAVIFIARRPRAPIAALFRFLPAVLPGLMLYLYLPVRSAQNPSLDWGNPENWANFCRHVTAGQYGPLVFGTSWGEFLGRIVNLPWIDHWGIAGAILSLLGVLILLVSSRSGQGRVIGTAVLIYTAWVIVFASGYRVTDYEIFLYPLAVPVCMAIAVGLGISATRLGAFNKVLPWVLAVLVLGAIAYDANYRRIDMDASNPMRNSAALFASRALRTLPEDALAITFSDGNCFALMYGVTCGIVDPSTGERLGPRHDVDVVVANWVMNDWFRQNVRDRWGADGRLRFISPSHERDQALRILVDQNLGRRPIFVDRDVLEMLEGPGKHYEVELTEPLIRIVPPD